MKKNIVILGSNNLIGVKAIDFFKNNLNKYKIIGLSYDSKINNIDLFILQIKELNPKRVFVVNQKDAEYIESKVKVDIFCNHDNFTEFIKFSQINEVVSAISGIASVKKILSSIYEFKDITLLNTSPLLYCGKIIVNEAKSKGVNLNIFSYPVYSLDFFKNFKNISDIDKIYLFSKKRNNTAISINNFNNYISYLKEFYSLNKIRLVNDMFLINYIYDISPGDFSFYSQSSKIININLKFINGTSIIFASVLNLESMFNYYFLKLDKIEKKDILDKNEISLSFKKIDISKEKYLDLGVSALKRGGSCPIIYYITIETLLNLIYTRKIKEKIDIFSILKEFVEDKSLYNKYPDLDSVCAIEETIIKKITKEYSK
jgi:1-deoxy-D-xylulose 5-phosphate reductoisomerase